MFGFNLKPEFIYDLLNSGFLNLIYTAIFLL